MIAIEAPKTALLNARIEGCQVNPAEHHHQEHSRGHAEFVMSRGELMRFNECPAKWIAFAKEDESELMAWGELIDCMILTPEQFQDRFAVCPETYPDAKTKEAKPWNFNANFCKQWREHHEGKTVIKHDTRKNAESAVQKLHDCPEFEDASVAAKFQVELAGSYSDSKTGLTIDLRALVDIVPAGGECANSLIDLKTTASAEPRDWARSVSKNHLDAQAALYLDLWNAASGEGRTDFRHIVQESSPPYHVEFRLLSQEFIELGRLKYQSALKKYCQCLQERVWPGYDNSMHLTFGRWALCEPEAYMLR